MRGTGMPSFSATCRWPNTGGLAMMACAENGFLSPVHTPTSIQYQNQGVYSFLPGMNHATLAAQRIHSNG